MAKGCAWVSLAVSIENPRARQLYERIGYRDWGHGLLDVSWPVRDDVGNETLHTEQVSYLVKTLG